MIINRSNLNALNTGFKLVFQQAFDAAQSDHEKVCMVVPSTTSKEVYPWLGSTTSFREWLGDRVIQNLQTHDFTIKNRSFENTVGVDRDTIEDDTYGIYNPMMAQLGQDAKLHPAQLVWALLMAGFSTACFDGQYFFDTDHPVRNADGSVSSVSNTGGGTGTAWFLLDISRVIRPIILQKRRDYQFVSLDKPDDANVFWRKEYVYGVDARLNVGFGLWQLAYASKLELNTTNYAAARTAMMNFKGDNGKPLGVIPNLLVVPPSLEKNGLEVLKNERDAYGATNTYKGTAELLCTPWLNA